jgi:hypothetical protein
MYWKGQEKFVFDIVLFTLVAFQLATLFLIIAGADALQLLIMSLLNVIFLGGMVPYGKWVWGTASYKEALFHVIKHELIILGGECPRCCRCCPHSSCHDLLIELSRPHW